MNAENFEFSENKKSIYSKITTADAELKDTIESN